MENNFPFPFEKREGVDLRLGIKSSLSSLKPLVAALYVIYKTSDGIANVLYSEEIGDTTKNITLNRGLKQKIDDFYGEEVSYKVSKTSLFTSQCESLQVGCELFFGLAKICFVDNNRQERTSKSRYNKSISFTEKVILLDLIISTYPKDEILAFLNDWLDNKDSIDPISKQECEISKKVKLCLTTFTENCCFKIKKEGGDEIIFKLDGVYKSLLENNEVCYKDGDLEIVGPLRILNSFVSENMHYGIAKSKSNFIIKNGQGNWLRNYEELVSTGLDLTPREPPVNTFSRPVPVDTASSSSILPYLTALRAKPFLLLAGISGTGKSRIVRKLAQATLPKALQEEWAGCTYTDGEWEEVRWGLQRPANFELIQVKPNWHNSMDVVGYQSNLPSPHYVFTPFVRFVVRACANPGVPFFLCLDEMNLAPVEEYFAEFLSAIESRSKSGGEYKTDPLIPPFKSFNEELADGCRSLCDKMVNELLPDFKASDTSTVLGQIAERLREDGLTLPENLLVVGTVNMDETTFSFSRKVLDRAMSIEMNEVDYDSFLSGGTDDGLKSLVASCPDFGRLLVSRHVDAAEVVPGLGDDARRVVDYLKRVNCLLDGTPFKLGYRAANEALIYLESVRTFGAGDYSEAMDRFTLMKVLSRLEGDETKLKLTGSESDSARLTKAGVDRVTAGQHGDMTLLTALRYIIVGELDTEELASVKKLDCMISQLSRDHFVSFWN